MKYGLVDETAINDLDLRLPADHPDTAERLKMFTDKSKPEIYTGCAKWARKEWEGVIYPEGTKEKDFLSKYVEQFNAVELNSTFYNMKKAHVSAWASQAPDGFKFCPKFSRRISHIKRLIIEDDFLNYFITTTRLMGDKLGLPFLQMPENFTPKYLDRLEEFLKHIPADYPMAIELRHEDWFKPEHSDRTFEVVRKYGKTVVITDVAGKRDILHMRLTSPVVFIRFNGYGLTESTWARIDEWVERLKEWISLGLKTIYFFPHQEDETFTPETCHYFIKRMNEVCGMSIPLPQILNLQQKNGEG